MRSLPRLLLAAACALGGVAAANAAVIDFENVPGQSVSPSTPYLEGGAVLTPSTTGASVVEAGGSSNIVGNSDAWFSFAQGNIITLTTESGDVFDLLSVIVGPDVAALARIRVSGYFATGGLTILTRGAITSATLLELDWIGLNSVTFETLESTAGIDDIVVAGAGLSDVPLPAAAPLLLMGLGGIAALRRRG